MTSGNPIDDALRIKVTLNARSKGRYYSEGTIRHLIREPTGAFFYSHLEDVWLLRTGRGKQGGEKIILKFVVEGDGDTVVVISQTSDHYDWSQMEHHHEAPYPTPGDGHAK